MDICPGATVRNITEGSFDDPFLETPMSDVCSMNESEFSIFQNTYNKIVATNGSMTFDVMTMVTDFCFQDCNFTCPAYIYSVATDSALVKERLSVFMPPTHFSYSFAIPFVVLIGMLLLLGIAGNFLTIIVIIRNKVLQASSHYLVSMAVSDILILILTGPTEMAANIHFWPWNYTRILCRLRYFLIEAGAFTTVLHIVTFTIERYLVICYPIKAKALVSVSRTKKIICLIWILSFLIAFPIFFAYDMLYACEGIPESTVCEVKDDIWEVRVQTFYIFSSIILFFIPMILITVLYSLIARVLAGYNGKFTMRRNSSVASRRGKGVKNPKDELEDGIEKSRKQVVKMLALIAFCFFACWFPFHVIRLMPHFGVEYWSEWFRDTFYHKWLYHASILLLYTSSVINPFLYNLMSKRFRRAVRATLGCNTKAVKFKTAPSRATRSISVSGATSL